MKTRPLDIGVLLLGIAAVSYVLLLWLECPARRRELELKSAELDQPSFEIVDNRNGELNFPFLLEKKSGIVYRLLTNPELAWGQMKYISLYGNTQGRPQVQVKPLTTEERKELADLVKQRSQPVP